MAAITPVEPLGSLHARVEDIGEKMDEIHSGSELEAESSRPRWLGVL